MREMRRRVEEDEEDREGWNGEREEGGRERRL